MKNKKIMGFLALVMMSTSASASVIQIDFGSEDQGGNLFLGGFSFDLNNPDEVNTGELPKQLTTTYNNSSSYVTAVNSSNDVYLDYTDNFVVETSSELTQLVSAGTYDLVLLAGDSEGATYSDDDNLVDGVEFALYALFDQNTFNLATDTGNLPSFLNALPVATFFDITKMSNGVETFYGAGIADISVSSVPVPAAVWLFGTAIAGLAIKRKKT